MATKLESLLTAIKADPGLKASISANQIGKGVAAADLMNTVLLQMVAQTRVNADGLVTPEDMQTVSRALWKDANAAAWRNFWVGHGNDSGDNVSGYHWVQNDGGTLQFRGRNFVDTVADGIYHYGFKIRGGRYFNEDGNDNETVVDVAGWLNFFLNGKNMVYGSAGADSLGTGDYSDYFAAARNETFMAGLGDDEIWAGDGNDVVLAGDGNDKSGGGTGRDRLYGEAGNDTLYGDDGADTLYGGAGKDVLGGGTGNDRLYGDGGADTLYGSEGNDRLFGGGGWDKMNGDAGADMLRGGGGNDEMSGGQGNDRLYGDAGNDTLSGGDGRDLVQGGAGADLITLWENDVAADTIVFAKGDSGKTAATIDRVEGFESGSDKIDLTDLGPMSFQKLDFRGGGKASAFYDGHFLRIDTDGNAAVDMIIEFAWLSELSAGDFLFA
ncbi:MAG: calcium-binding protein [Paracoccaceae bacterium]|nr:calcium-binding protein [Paracoccaceae bacterium]